MQAAQSQPPLLPPDSLPSARPLAGRLDAELEGFAAADPELLAPRDLLRRIDTKFVVPEAMVAELLAKLRGSYAIVCSGAIRAAAYRTLYFDTPELRCFRDHLSGRRPRHKVRIRHYPDRAVSFLEVKTKRAEGLTVKHRARRPFDEDQLGEADAAFIGRYCDLPVASLQPVVWTNFHRVTLISVVATERVTIDLGVTAIAGDTAEDLPGVAILEIKQPELCYDTPVMRALRAAGRHPAPASKYCIGVARTQGDLAAYHPMAALRAVERP